MSLANHGQIVEVTINAPRSGHRRGQGLRGRGQTRNLRYVRSTKWRTGNTDLRLPNGEGFYSARTSPRQRRIHREGASPANFSVTAPPPAESPHPGDRHLNLTYPCRSSPAPALRRRARRPVPLPSVRTDRDATATWTPLLPRSVRTEHTSSSASRRRLHADGSGSWSGLTKSVTGNLADITAPPERHAAALGQGEGNIRDASGAVSPTDGGLSASGLATRTTRRPTAGRTPSRTSAGARSRCRRPKTTRCRPLRRHPLD